MMQISSEKSELRRCQDLVVKNFLPINRTHVLWELMRLDRPDLKDNIKARRLLSDGKYERFVPSPGEKKLNSQEWLIENRGLWHG
jgi:hypothetical protein